MWNESVSFLNSNKYSDIQASVYVEQYLRGPRLLLSFPFHAMAPFCVGETNCTDKSVHSKRCAIQRNSTAPTNLESHLCYFPDMLLGI